MWSERIGNRGPWRSGAVTHERGDYEETINPWTKDAQENSLPILPPDDIKRQDLFRQIPRSRVGHTLIRL